MEPVLGIDVGGVIMGRGDGTADTSFFSLNYLKTPATEGMFEAVKVLVDRFDRRVHIVSKAHAKTQAKTLEWLDRNGFYDKTGAPRNNVHFCLEREGKAPICQGLGITHFIDDRIDVLEFLRGIVGHRYLFIHEWKPTRVQFTEVPEGILVAPNWAAVLESIGQGWAP